MTGAVSSKRYSKPVKLFTVRMSRRSDVQWIRTIKVVLEPPKLHLTEIFSQGKLFYR